MFIKPIAFPKELTIKMKEAENEDGEGKRKVEALWESLSNTASNFSPFF